MDVVGFYLFYYEQQIKRELKRIHISGGRYNERLGWWILKDEPKGLFFQFITTDNRECVGVMKDKETKFEEIESSHTLGGTVIHT